jgi:predicted deacetylase
MRRETRGLVVSIHDVAPQYHREVARWREMLLLREAGPVALLVVPRHHGLAHEEGPRLQWLRRLADAGDEIAMHGYAHVGVAGGEAEMKGRAPQEIRSRVTEGLAELRGLGLDPTGFVAPCYAHPPACDAACRDAGLDWWATRGRLSFPGGQRVLASVGLGASKPVKRAWSPVLARAAVRALAPVDALRLDLHPADLRHARLAQAGIDLVELLLAQGRRLTTHAALVESVRTERVVLAAS